MTVSRVKKQPRSLSLSKKTMIHLTFIIVFAVLAAHFLSNPNKISYFPIKVVKVIGAKHIDHQEVQNSLLPLINRGYFRTEVSAIKEKLMQFSWVSQVNVRRVWPDQIWIRITEKQPIAKWNDANLLSTAGDLFLPNLNSKMPEGLPNFYGPEGKQFYMMQYYQQMNNLLVPLHFKVTKLELTPGHIWNITLDNGIKLTFGRKDFLTRFSHFVKVYPKIIGSRASEIDYIDLRYANGLAVKWKTVT